MRSVWIAAMQRIGTGEMVSLARLEDEPGFAFLGDSFWTFF